MFLKGYGEKSLTLGVLSDLLRWRRVGSVYVSESVSGNMVNQTLESSKLGSANKDPLVLPDLSSPHLADHLVLSMYGHPSKPR